MPRAQARSPSLLENHCVGFTNWIFHWLVPLLWLVNCLVLGWRGGGEEREKERERTGKVRFIGWHSSTKPHQPGLYFFLALTWATRPFWEFSLHWLPGFALSFLIAWLHLLHTLKIDIPHGSILSFSLPSLHLLLSHCTFNGGFHLHVNNPQIFISSHDISQASILIYVAKLNILWFLLNISEAP